MAIASVATIPSVSLSLLTGPLGAASGSSLPTLTAMASLVEGPSLSSGSVPAGLKLSSTFPPLPAKLVAKAQAGLYVEMKELLTDNISLQHQLDALHSQPAVQLPAAVRPRMREVGSPLVWVYCFLAYAAIRAPDQGTRDRLTYARLLLREAMRHGEWAGKSTTVFFVSRRPWTLPAPGVSSMRASLQQPSSAAGRGLGHRVHSATKSIIRPRIVLWCSSKPLLQRLHQPHVRVHWLATNPQPECRWGRDR